MAKQIVAGVEFGTLKSGKAYARTPRYEFAFKRCMNGASAQWKKGIFNGVEEMMWVFDPVHMEHLMEMARRIYGGEVEEAPAATPARTAKEEFAVALGKGLGDASQW